MKRNRGAGIIALLMTALMTITMIPAFGSLEVSADSDAGKSDYDRVMNIEDPANYDDQSFEPYGHGVDVPFYMNKQSELLFYRTSSQSSGDINTFYDTLKSAYTGDVLNGTKTKAMKEPPTMLKQAYFVQAVAFDPTGSGRDDHIAFIGVYYSGGTARCYVWAYDTRNRKWTSEFDLGTYKNQECKWMESTKITEYEAVHFLSITAGDYDGDGKDTLVAYCAFNGVRGYSMYELDCRNPDFKVKYHGDQYVGTELAHDEYDSVLCVDEHIATKMACELDTGDINNDGLDDLVALTYIGNHNDKSIKLEKYRPIVKISLGEKGGSGFTKKCNHKMGTWLYREGWWWDSMVSPGMSVGDIDNDGYDEIITAGISCPQKKKTTYTCERIHDDINEDSMRVSIMGYQDYEDDTGHIKTKFVEKYNGQMDTNAWTRSGFYEDEEMWNKLTVQCAAINGVGNAEMVFISGTLYRWDGKSLQAVHTPDLFKSSSDNLADKASTNMFVQSTAVGNFDGNGKGYEQIAFTVSCKTQSKRSYDYLCGVIGGKNYNDSTGIAKEYYSTGKGSMDDDNAWPGSGKDNASGYVSEHKGLNCIAVAADNDNDGVMARYKEKALIFADPEVLCVLQAPPYFEEVKDYLTDTSETKYEVSDIYSYDKTKNDSISYGVGVVAGMESPAIQMEMTAGYALDWSKEFSEGHEIKYTLGWSARGEDLVLIERKPIVAYYYEFQEKNGDWSGDYMVVTVPCEPDLITLGIDDYNNFAKYYNKKLKESNYLSDYHNTNVPEFMKEYHTLDLLENQWLGHEGDPSGYIKSTDGRFKSDSRYKILQKTAMRLGHNSESVSWGNTSSTSIGVTESMSHGFTYDATIAMGPNVGPASLYVGLSTSLQYMTGESTTTTQTKEQGISCEVNGLKVKEMPASMRGNEYNFSFKMARWPSGMKHYVNGVAEDIPVYGYALSGITKPSMDDSITVEDQLKASEVNDQLNQLPQLENVTLDDEKAIASVRDKYEALSDAAKTLVDVSVLEALESRIELLKNGGTDITDASVVLSANAFVYNGKVRKPKIITINGYILKEGLDYTLEWSNESSKTPGTYYVTITGKGLCTGTVKVSYKIKKAGQKVTVTKASYNKTFGDAAFSLGAKTNGDGTLTYKSGNTGVATVSSTGKVTIKGAGSTTITVFAAETANYNKSEEQKIAIKVSKAANPMSVKGKTAAVKYKKLKKKAQTIKRAKAITLNKAKGKVTYKLSSVSDKKFRKYFKVNAKNGNITVKKGLKKGVYKLKVKVKAAGNSNYKASAEKTVKITIKVN